ncbi:heparinase II/III family protein [Pandoraea cepalis]|nr:heparinase II/III-family protein [Pandoraea cepalis]
MPRSPSSSEPFFAFESARSSPQGSAILSELARPDIVEQADALLAGTLKFYGDRDWRVGFPPAWHRNPRSGEDALNVRGTHWSDINEFSLNAGDIKDLWEPSRFDGLVLLAQSWLITRASKYANAVEQWLGDWCRENPVSCGVNWKCAQEAGIRLMHVLLVAEMLDRYAGVARRGGFWAFVDTHCARIAPTMLYAIAQDNNHATSEAAALYMAGLAGIRWADAPAALAVAARRWHALGRKWLPNRVDRLVMPDGSFSQHSTNYHRLMLDTLSLAQWWCDRLRDQPLGGQWQVRTQAAARWLCAMTDPRSGGAPNLGANDGARLINLDGAPYRDFRPSVQTAYFIFFRARRYVAGPWDRTGRWLGIEIPERIDATPERTRFPDGGYAMLPLGDDGRVWLRLPTFRFRPSHADGLHMDLWWRGTNVLRDGGTYSYNTDTTTLDYFSGTASHNTLQFDARNQMPRLSRFLFGDWLQCEQATTLPEQGVVTAAYRNRVGDWHKREMKVVGGNEVRVTDEFASNASQTTLRWRLAPGNWRLRGNECTDGSTTLRVDGASTLCLETGWESLCYGQRDEIPVLVARAPAKGRIETSIRLN